MKEKQQRIRDLFDRITPMETARSQPISVTISLNVVVHLKKGRVCSNDVAFPGSASLPLN
jgi:hypothetical protein